MFQKKDGTPVGCFNLLHSGADATSWLGELGLLIGRMYLGLTICKAGVSKFPTADWFQDQVAGLNVPAPVAMAFLASTSEFVGGALLLIGLFTRPAAFFAAVTMGVATFGFHKNSIGEMHIAQLYFWMLVLFSLMGGGRLSVDGLLRRWSLTQKGLDHKFLSYASLARMLPIVLLAVAIWLERRPRAIPVDPVSKIEQISLAGTFNGWNLNTHPLTVNSEGVWTATFNVEAPGEVEFKFVVNRDWRSNIGDTDQSEVGLPASGTAVLDDGNNSTSNIRAYIPRVGSYIVTFDLDTRNYRVIAAEEEEEKPKDL